MSSRVVLLAFLSACSGIPFDHAAGGDTVEWAEVIDEVEVEPSRRAADAGCTSLRAWAGPVENADSDLGQPFGVGVSGETCGQSVLQISRLATSGDILVIHAERAAGPELGTTPSLQQVIVLTEDEGWDQIELRVRYSGL